MTLRKNKNPKQRIFPQKERSPRGIGKAESYDNSCLSWNIEILDNGGPWSWKNINPIVWWRHICPAIHNFGTMKWNEILGDRHHIIDIDKIIPEARKRLEEICCDIDCLCSLAIGSKKRIYGIKQCNAFKALWWDPKHEICPSIKKHT